MPGKIEGECQLCKSKKAIYRCPICSVVYCSLGCYKTHKGDCTNSSQISSDTLNTTKSKLEDTNSAIFLSEDDKEKDYVPVETLRELGSSKHLKGLLGNRHLRDILLEIDSAKDQSKTLEYAMQIPIFTEFVDECLRVVEPDEHTTKSFMPN